MSTTRASRIFDGHFDSRNVVVMGAARGIGAALARRFHAAGARVVVADRDSVATVADELERAVEVIADVSTEAGNVALIERAEEAFGPIDLFFANAGVVGGADLDTPEDAWQHTFDVNVNAHRWAAKHLVPGWVARGEGYFCSTASAWRATSARTAARSYCARVLGVVGFAWACGEASRAAGKNSSSSLSVALTGASSSTSGG